MDAFADRIAACAATLRTACEAAGIAPRGDDRISEAEAAALLGCSVRTLQRWRTEGTGPTPRKIGGRWFYGLDALAANEVLSTGHAPSTRYYAPELRQNPPKRDSEAKRKRAR